jgi:hypothetical protein
MVPRPRLMTGMLVVGIFTCCRQRCANQWALELPWSALISQRLIQCGWLRQYFDYISFTSVLSILSVLWVQGKFLFTEKISMKCYTLCLLFGYSKIVTITNFMKSIYQSVLVVFKYAFSVAFSSGLYCDQWMDDCEWWIGKDEEESGCWLF